MRFPLFISIILIATAPAYGREEIAWLTSDYTTGGFVIQQAGECEANELPIEVAGDAVVRSQDGYILVINRFGYDNVTVLSAENPEEVLSQFSTGNGSNPQDILIVDGHKAYVTLLANPEILIVDFVQGEILGRINLSAFADTSDGIPEATHLIPHGDHVFVMCQRLDQTTQYWDPAGPGCLAKIDPEVDAPVDADPLTPEMDPVWLPFGNPISWSETVSNLLVACAGNWSIYDDGGLVSVDPSGQSMPEILITEFGANGNIYEVASTANAVYVAVSFADWTYAVYPFYIQSAGLGVALSGTSGGYIPDMVAHAGILYVADQGSFDAPELAGLILVDADADSLICGPVQTGLPPVSGAVVKSLGIHDNPLNDAALTLVKLWPNPASHSIRLTQSNANRHGLHVSVYDISGRLMKDTQARPSEYVMPLKDDRGRLLPSGTYILRIRAAHGTEDHALIISR